MDIVAYDNNEEETGGQNSINIVSTVSKGSSIDIIRTIESCYICFPRKKTIAILTSLLDQGGSILPGQVQLLFNDAYKDLIEQYGLQYDTHISFDSLDNLCQFLRLLVDELSIDGIKPRQIIILRNPLINAIIERLDLDERDNRWGISYQEA